VIVDRYSDYSIHLHIGRNSVAIGLIRKDYRPNGTLCNAELMTREWFDRPVDAQAVAECVERCVRATGVPCVAVWADS
jgi:hypothetical protein